jgi:FkbM family methyltransferase
MNLNLIKKYFDPIRILDIGANNGQFYIESKKIFPNAYFLLVEGNEYCEPSLKTLGVDYKISLLSDKIKEVNFYIRKEEYTCTGNSIYREKTSFYDDDNKVLIVKKHTNTLSNLLGTEYFDLIKIDVQGSEIDIMNGGLDIIKNCKGVLMEVSLEEFNEGSPTIEYTIEFMKKLNFEKSEIINNLNHPIKHTLIQQDILFINKGY